MAVPPSTIAEPEGLEHEAAATPLPVRVLALPRDPNPYQDLLYGAMAQHGFRVRYAGELTRSHTINLLALPFELVAERLKGGRLLHVHWVFGFRFPFAPRSRVARRVARAWFGLTLRAARLAGLRVVWTAHNVLPHEAVFDDDVAARRTLVGAADLVHAHSHATIDDLTSRVQAPARVAVIPLGPLAPAPPAPARHPRVAGAPLRVLLFGRIVAYKGAEELLRAASQCAADVHVTVAGVCDDAVLAARLRDQAAAAPERIDLQLRRLSDGELEAAIAAADVVALPFRAITTSASVQLAMDHGRPVVVPDLAALAELGDGVLRYDGTIAGLATTLDALARADDDELATLGDRAAHAARRTSWPEIAAQWDVALRAPLEERAR